MKVLYVAFHDPMDMDVGNGMDYFRYHSICDRGFEVKYIWSLQLFRLRGWNNWLPESINGAGSAI